MRQEQLLGEQTNLPAADYCMHPQGTGLLLANCDSSQQPLYVAGGLRTMKR